MLMGRTEFVRKYPVATKRVLRAILKAADLCVADPERAARLLVDRGFIPRFDYTLQALERIALQCLAGLRPGRHGALVCAAAE